jgi:transcriptional regulator with PAS, ATPase and Fis domain
MRPPLTLTLSTESGDDFVEIPGAQARLESPSGKEATAAFGLGAITVGSSPECTLVSDDPGVSRVHCQLTLSRAGVVIKDLGSKNGTLVAGLRVLEAVLPPALPAVLGASRLTISSTDGSNKIPLSTTPSFGAARGASVPMRALFAKLKRASAADVPILLFGESGTGKELLAHAIHEESRRRDGPFVVFDCGAVAPSLIEAELFGHAKGAFTGASVARTGLLEEADGGTLFLDELGELPLDLQPRLLRALETRQVRPLGTREWRKADARIVAATHRDLRARMAQGTFREDLFFRLAVVEAQIPPLRERKEDIPLLVEQFLSMQVPPRSLADLPAHALDLLQGHGWPGNIRELRNTVSRLVLFPELGPGALHGKQEVRSDDVLAPVLHLPLREARDLTVSEFERRYIGAKLREHGGNVSAAARAMAVSRQFLHRLMARYELRGRDD